MNDLNQAIEAYLALREQHKEADRVAKQLYWAKMGAERALVEAMEASDSGSKKSLSTGVVVSLRNHVDCSVTIENQDQIREWLMEEFGDDKDYVEEKVIKAEITKLCKKRIKAAKEKNEDPHSLEIATPDVPDFLKLKTLRKVSVTT